VTTLVELLALQRIDSAVDQAKHRKANLAERARHQRATLEMATVEARAAALATQRAALEVQQNDLEARIDVASKRIVEIEKRLKILSTPREITALEHERENLSAQRSALEDTDLEVMELMETIQRDSAVNVDETNAAQIELDEAATTLTEAETSAEQELDVLGMQRAQSVAVIEAALLARYEWMRARLGGVAVATIEHGHCTGCRLQVAAGELDRIRAEAADALVACEQCGRLLAR
jgi:uncharacterized protein